VKALDNINNNLEITTFWNITNTIAIDRMNMTDHGPVHFQVVANIGLRLARILNKNKIPMSSVKDLELTYEHAELIILLASLFHDMGMTASRVGHEEFSLVITFPLLREILDFLPIEERTKVIAETLHAIVNHRKVGKPLTLEGGILTVADALDMNQGRSKLNFEAGKIDIHTASASAIDDVEIKEGKDVPVEITIHMNNSAGLFQVDQLLKKKLSSSGIKDYFSITAKINKKEKRLIEEFKV
jgi:hypothetical protein